MYSQYASEYDNAAENNIYNACLERPSTLALLDDVADMTVVDMGCGSGIYAKWLLDHGVKRLTCVDASAQMINLTQAKFGDRLSAYVQDISQGLPQEPSVSADLILCPLVLHYIQDLAPVFNEVYRVLKPGGYMVFSTHHPLVDFESTQSGNYFEQERITEQWNTIGKPVEVSFYRRSLTQLFGAVTSAGLVITKVSEGDINERAKQICPDTYQRLKTNPNFLFVRCEKP